MDELALAVATTVATKGGEALVSGAQTAVGALVRLVRDRLNRAGECRCPSDLASSEVEEVAGRLVLLMREDPTFAVALRRLWGRASVELSAADEGVVNMFTGSARNVVQARDIHGGVSF